MTVFRKKIFAMNWTESLCNFFNWLGVNHPNVSNLFKGTRVLFCLRNYVQWKWNLHRRQCDISLWVLSKLHRIWYSCIWPDLDPLVLPEVFSVLCDEVVLPAVVSHRRELDWPPQRAEGLDGLSETGDGQVSSLTQFYSVDFSQSRIIVKKCVFDKRTIKRCAAAVFDDVLGPLRLSAQHTWYVLDSP